MRKRAVVIGLLLTVHLALAALAAVRVMAAGGHDHGSHESTPAAGTGAKTTSKAQAKPTGDPYPLDFCPVTGEKLGGMGAPIVEQYEGREIRFCCAACPPKFKANPAKYLTSVDAAIVKQQLPYYPLDTCPVTGEKLGSMGKPVDYVYNNRLVRFCCAGCIEEFKTHAADYMAKLDEAVVRAQKDSYPLTHCIVLPDEAIGGEDEVDYVVANRLFRLCCPGCRDDINANPAYWLHKLDEAGQGS